MHTYIPKSEKDFYEEALNLLKKISDLSGDRYRQLHCIASTLLDAYDRGVDETIIELGRIKK